MFNCLDKPHNTKVTPRKIEKNNKHKKNHDMFKPDRWKDFQAKRPNDTCLGSVEDIHNYTGWSSRLSYFLLIIKYQHIQRTYSIPCLTLRDNFMRENK